MADLLSSNIEQIGARIASACQRVGRDPESVKLIGVSKTHPATLISKAIAAGLSVFGENKVQEAENKIVELGRQRAEWHLIGHLQSNKARKAVQLFDVIHTLDSIELAERLERICEEEGRERLSVLVQVDLAGEETKSGIAVEMLGEVAEFLAKCRRLSFEGLMVLPPFFDDPNAAWPYFVKLRELRDKFAPGGELSMGMSHDFEVAIEEGATMIRVGSAIFGGR